MSRAKSPHELRNVLGSQRAQEAERHRAAVGDLEVGKLAAAVVDLAQRALHPRQKQLAGSGQPDRPSRALKQLHAEIGLQPGERAAQRRLAGPKLLGGARDVLQAPGDAKAFEQVPVGLDHINRRSLLMHL